MQVRELENFISSIMVQKSDSLYFWNLFALATNDLTNYNGPKTVEEFTKQVHNAKSELEYRCQLYLWTLYMELQHTKKRPWSGLVKVLAPLAVSDSNMPRVMRHMPKGWEDIDCYTKLLNFVDDNPLELSDKLIYEILSKLIDKLGNKTLASSYNDIATVYRDARWQRAYMYMGISNNILETQMQDFYYLMKTENDSIELRESFGAWIIDICYIILCKDETLGDTKAIQNICTKAKNVAAESGSKELMDESNDIFDADYLINIPNMLMQQINKRGK